MTRKMKRHRIPLDDGRFAEVELPDPPTRAEVDAVIAKCFAGAERNALTLASAAGQAPASYVPVGWRRAGDAKTDDPSS